jgi:hypothetical protein
VRARFDRGGPLFLSATPSDNVRTIAMLEATCLWSLIVKTTAIGSRSCRWTIYSICSCQHSCGSFAALRRARHDAE